MPPLGTWEWISTEESAGVFTTPINAGHTVEFEFNDDLTFVEYRDQMYRAAGVFWVQDVPYNDEIIPVLALDYGDVSVPRCAYGVSEDDGILHLYWGSDPHFGLPSFPIERYVPRDPVPTVSESWGTIKLLYR